MKAGGGGVSKKKKKRRAMDVDGGCGRMRERHEGLHSQSKSSVGRRDGRSAFGAYSKVDALT